MLSIKSLLNKSWKFRIGSLCFIAKVTYFSYIKIYEYFLRNMDFIKFASAMECLQFCYTFIFK